MSYIDISIKKEKRPNIFQYYSSKMMKSTVIFMIGIAVGCFFVWYSQNKPSTSYVDFITGDDLYMESPSVISVFTKNVLVSLIMCTGCITGRLLPEIIIFINGIFFGCVNFSYLYSESSGLMLLALLPHSVIELPLLLFSSSIGINRFKKYGLSEYIKLSTCIIAGFLVAAIIEVHISYRLSLVLQ